MLKRFKLGVKLIAGFVIVASLIVLAGVVGMRGLGTVSDNAEVILTSLVPQADASMELIICAIESQDQAASYLLESEPSKLAEIRKTFDEGTRRFDALADAMLRGGTVGDITIVATKSDEVRRLVDNARSVHEQFTKSSSEMMEHHLRAVERQHVTLSDEEQLARQDMDALDGHGETIMKVLKTVEETQQKLMAGAMSDADQAQSTANTTMIVLAILGFAIALTLGFVLTFSITRPMAKISLAAERIATGDVNQNIEHESHDEIGFLAQSFRNMIAYMKRMADSATALSKGDLSVQVSPASEKDLLGHAMVTVNQNIGSMVADGRTLAQAAVEGRLDIRVDASRHQGEYRKIVDGINSTIATLVGHIDSMPAPAMIIDREFNIRFMNETGAKVGGRTKQQLVGTKCYDYFKTSDCHTARCACARAMSEGRMANSETDAHPAGMNLEIAYTGVPIRDTNGQVIGAFEVVTDQTAVKQAAKLATKNEAYMKVEVAKLTDNLGRMSEGNLEFELKAESGDSETAELSRNFQAIADAVNRSASAVKALVADTKALANAAVEGNLTTRADAGKHRGEYRQIVEGINSTLDAILKPIEEASAVLERVAARDLSARVKGDYRGDHTRIKSSLNTATENLDQALSQVAVGSEQVASAATEISSGSQALAQGASEQASSLEEIASSLQEMASMTKQNASNATEAKGLSDSAQATASKGVDSMHRLSDAVDKIKASSDATAKIVKTIDEIAFQTNLLALNAAVEAARAGDAGKGFAVVAEEVRNLAMRSAEAAKNTANMIEESVKNADNGVQLNMEVLKNLDEINSQVMKVGEVMSEIAAASEQQSQGVDQINTAVEQMNQVTQQNAASSEESASASEQLTGQAEEMKSLVASFTLTNANTSTTRRAHRPAAAASITPRATKTSTSGNGGHRSGKDKGSTLIPFEEEKESVVLQEF